MDTPNGIRNEGRLPALQARLCGRAADEDLWQIRVRTLVRIRIPARACIHNVVLGPTDATCDHNNDTCQNLLSETLELSLGRSLALHKWEFFRCTNCAAT